jgi:hypothetical protein
MKEYSPRFQYKIYIHPRIYFKDVSTTFCVAQSAHSKPLYNPSGAAEEDGSK